MYLAVCQQAARSQGAAGRPPWVLVPSEPPRLGSFLIDEFLTVVVRKASSSSKGKAFSSIYGINKDFH